MTAPRALVLRCAGTNCDREAVDGFARAGARVDLVHVRRIYERPEILRETDLVVFPGGFSYGDDLGAGTIQALETRLFLLEALGEVVARGGLVVGICNGFQVLVKSGLLPGRRRGEVEVTLAGNDSNRFEDRWVRLRVEDSRAVHLPKGLEFDVPVAHGEGKFVAKDEATLEAMRVERLVAFRYVAPGGDEPAFPWNPNGSQDAIAGICDPTGRILGLMPHPERNVLFHHHPDWTRKRDRREGAGLGILRALVDAARR